MLHKLLLTFPLLSLAFLSLASPLEPRAPGLIDNLLTGVLSGIPKLIKDILDATVSGLSDQISSKPLSCALDACCICEPHYILFNGILLAKPPRV